MPTIQRSRHGMIVSLLMACAMAFAARPALGAETSLPLCQALADGYSALIGRNPDAALRKVDGEDSLGGSIYPMSPVQALNGDAAGGLKLARTIITLTDYTDDAFVAAAEKLPERFAPSAALLQAMADDENQYVEVQHLSGSPYYLAIGVEGTAHCAVTTWFSVRDGRGEPMAGPKSWEDAGEGGGNCGIDAGFGSLNGVRVAVIDGGGGLTPDMSVSAMLTARTGDGWAPACTTTFDFAPRFDAEHVVNPPDKPQACTDTACLKRREAVLAELEAFQAGPQAAQAKALAALSADQRTAFDKLKQAWKPDGGSSDDVGDPSPQVSDSPGDAVDTKPVALPLQADGKLYLATIGHRTIGWRIFGDYEVDVYALKDGALDQVNTFVVGMARGKLLKATAKEGAE